MNKQKALVLRTCNEDLASRNNFQWPESGPVECSDWDPTPNCGNGLHGLLWGEGNGCLLDQNIGAKWLVVEVELSAIVEVTQNNGGKVKFPRGNVVFCGTREEAISFLDERGAKNKAVVFAQRTAGDYGIAPVGYRGTATVGDFGTATAGKSGTAIAGNAGIATVGYRGIATAGDRGTATVGDFGIATVGYRGIATAGKKGELRIRYYDFRSERYRTVIAYVGEDGIKPNTKYKLVDRKFVEVNE